MLILAALLGVALTGNPLKILAMAAIVSLGSGQAITMPLFFGSSALYPVDLMPGWLKVFNLDFGVLILASAVMISIAAARLGRLTP